MLMSRFRPSKGPVLAGLALCLVLVLSGHVIRL